MTVLLFLVRSTESYQTELWMTGVN